MEINMDWIKEEWATDLMKQIASDVFAPKPKEQPIFSPQLGGSVSFGDWVIPVTIVAVVLVILFFVFKIGSKATAL